MHKEKVNKKKANLLQSTNSCNSTNTPQKKTYITPKQINMNTVQLLDTCSINSSNGRLEQQIL